MYRYAELAEADVEQGKLQDARQAILQAFLPRETPISYGELPDVLMARGYVRMSDHDYLGAEVDFKRARDIAHMQGNVYYEMEIAFGFDGASYRGKAGVCAAGTESPETRR